MSRASSSVIPLDSRSGIQDAQNTKPGVMAKALWFALAPAFISVCLTGFAVSAVINALTRKPADVPSTDEVPV